MLGVLVSVLQLVAIGNALLRSARERFAIGVVGGCARALLLVAGAVGVVRARFALFSGGDVPPPSLATAMALAATIVGPIVTFAVVWIAHRRRRNVPAAQEERLARPFDAWLPVALLDAAFLVINVLAAIISNPF